MYKLYTRKGDIIWKADNATEGLNLQNIRKKWLRPISLMSCFLLVHYASQAQTVSLNKQEAPLIAVFKEIKKQTGYDYIISNAQLKQAKSITIESRAESLQSVLDKCFSGQPFGYVINQKVIVVTPLKKEVPRPQQPTAQLINISGTVTNENGSPMAGVSIWAKKSKKSVYTNASGGFILKDLDPIEPVRISYTGYKTLEYMALGISLVNGQLQLETEAIMLNETIIQGKKPLKATRQLDLTNRRHLSLSQVLQGTIPGLTIKSKTTSNQELMLDLGLTGKEEVSLTELIDNYYPTSGLGLSKEEYKRRAEAALINSSTPYRLLTINSSSGEIPELRGAGTFNGNGNGILIVIDGFVQDNFPADYPMNNVVSIEVIKDPAETIKWGPKASNGVILITTNRGKAGHLQINYNSNINFSAPPNNSRAALKLMDSSQLLDYYMEAYNKGIYPPPSALTNKNISPFDVLLYQKQENKITAQAFKNSVDSLAGLTNGWQFRNAQQNLFRQNHSLNISGGSALYRFALNGLYGASQNEAVGNEQRNLGFNLHNQLALLQNKLQIALQINASGSNNKNGTKLDLYQFEPYQMLYNADGSYVYYYGYKRDLSFVEAQALQTAYPFLKHYGYNPLEDARVNQNSNRNRSLSSQLNIDWKLLPGLSWSNNLQYENSRNNNGQLQGFASSQVRALYNAYYAVKVDLYPDFKNTKPISLALMPAGDILKTSLDKNQSINYRSGLVYNKLIKKHNINSSLGLAWYSSSNQNLPYATRYGYHPTTGQGQQVIDTDGNNTSNLYYNVNETIIETRMLQEILTSFKSENRNLSLNASLNYEYNKRLGFNAFYNESFNPASTVKGYSATRNYNVLFFWQLDQEAFLRKSWLSTLKVSAGLGQIKMAQLDVAMPANRDDNPRWKRIGLVVTAYNPEVQNGGVVRNYDALLDAGLFNNALQGQFNYRSNSSGTENQLSGRFSYTFTKASWFKVPAISNLMVEGFVSSMSSGQALSQMMGTNSPLSGGGFGIATGNASLSALPPAIVNKELHLNLELFNSRLQFDARYYHRNTKGLNNGLGNQVDLTNGFLQQSLYSRMVNKGYEFYLQGKVINSKSLSWVSTINAAYNVNIALELAPIKFMSHAGYLSAMRPGYATDNLWSYRWAGLNAAGAPQVYDEAGNKIVAGLQPTEDIIAGKTDTWLMANDSWLEYSGRTTPPWSGACIQDLSYKGFFARATLQFGLGHVMRSYQPLVTGKNENSILVSERWQKPGDERLTDIAAMAAYDSTRALAIQNSSNSIMPADFLRLSEIQLGFTLPQSWLKGKSLKSMSISGNLQNVAVWVRNKQGIDPQAVGSNGALLPKQPIRYGLALSAGF